jgi:hypothetical protein
MTRGRFIDRARRRIGALAGSVRSRSTIRARVFQVALSALLAMVLATGALAYWTSTGSGTATAAVGTLNAPTKLALTYRTGTSSVKVSWEGSKLSNGTDAQGYYVTRNGASPAACGTSPTLLITYSTSCTDSSVPDGTYTYSVIAVWKSFSAESVASEAVTVKLDTTKPTAAISFPSPSGNGIYRSETWTEGCNVLSFKVTDSICGTAQDAGGGDVLTRVQISIQAPSGKYWESSKKEWAASSEQKLTASGTASWTSSFPETNFSQTGGGDGTYTVRAYATDEVGNESTATTTSFVLDTTAPTNSLSLTSASHAYLSSGTLYYKGNGSGSFSLLDAVTDSGSGPASATFPAISTGGWMHNAQTVSTSTGSNPTISYTSSSYSWTTPLTNPADQTITATDVAGNSGTSGGTIKFVSDTTAPTSGALSVNSTSASSGGSTSTATNSTSFAISSRTDYAETQSASQSGLQSSVLTIQSESLSGSTCGEPGLGGPFTSATVITGTTQPAGIVAGYCYLYKLTGTDNVGNVAAISTTVEDDALSFTVSTQPASVTAGTATANTAVVLTAIKNGATDTAYTGATLTWGGANNSPSGATPTLPASSTWTSGKATFAITLVKAETETLTVTDGTRSATFAPITVNPAAQKALEYVTTSAGTTKACPTGKVAGGTLTVFVAVLDEFGNLTVNGSSELTIGITEASGGGGEANPATLHVHANANPAVTSESSAFKLLVSKGNTKPTTYTAKSGSLKEVSCIVE